MAWTKSDLDAVEAAIATAAVAGFAEITIGTMNLKRYTLKELMDLRLVMQGAVAGVPRYSYGVYEKD